MVNDATASSATFVSVHALQGTCYAFGAGVLVTNKYADLFAQHWCR